KPFLHFGDGAPRGGIITRFRSGFGPVSASRLLKAPDACVKLDPIFALALGPVEGPVGRREELPLVSAGSVLGHPAAAGDRHDLAVAAQEGALGEGGADAIGELGAP